MLNVPLDADLAEAVARMEEQYGTARQIKSGRRLGNS